MIICGESSWPYLGRHLAHTEGLQGQKPIGPAEPFPGCPSPKWNERGNSFSALLGFTQVD